MTEKRIFKKLTNFNDQESIHILLKRLIHIALNNQGKSSGQTDFAQRLGKLCQEFNCVDQALADAIQVELIDSLALKKMGLNDGTALLDIVVNNRSNHSNVSVQYLLTNGFQRKPSVQFTRQFLFKWSIEFKHKNSVNCLKQVDSALSIFNEFSKAVSEEKQMEIDSDDFDLLTALKALIVQLESLMQEQDLQIKAA